MKHYSPRIYQCQSILNVIKQIYQFNGIKNFLILKFKTRELKVLMDVKYQQIYLNDLLQEVIYFLKDYFKKTILDPMFSIQIPYIEEKSQVLIVILTLIKIVNYFSHIQLGYLRIIFYPQIFLIFKFLVLQMNLVDFYFLLWKTLQFFSRNLANFHYFQIQFFLNLHFLQKLTCLVPSQCL